jgi:hypothetical protein
MHQRHLDVFFYGLFMDQQVLEAKGVQAYRPAPVLALVADGATVAALCYNLPEPPAPDERNVEDASKLRSLAERIGLPTDYVASIQ